MTLLRELRRLPPLETALLAFGIAILVWLAAASQAPESDASHLDSFSSFDAASGGYRALYAMLAAEGVRVSRFERRPAFLDASIGTLVYVEPYEFDPRQIQMTEIDLNALEAWVRGGGRLLYIGHDDEAAKRGVLHLPASAPAHDAVRPALRAPEIVAAGVGSVHAQSGARWKPRRGAFEVLFDDGRGPLAVRYPFGRGRVTALIDKELFENGNIGKPDRARFAFALARPPGATGSVAFDETAHGYLEPDHWWTVVPRSFAIALGVAVATILVAIAGAAVRLGPPLVPFERRDRSSADFIDALSTLLERGRATRKALLDASRSTSHAIARSFGLPDGVAESEIAARIERRDVREAYRDMVTVSANGFPDENNLLRGVALAQQLRKEFAPHGRPRN
jgi:hypothetical protein